MSVSIRLKRFGTKKRPYYRVVVIDSRLSDSGRPLEEIERDTERDNWKTPDEALEYGLIDKIVTNRK